MKRTMAWGLVGVQLVLILMLAFIPRGELWAVGILQFIAAGLIGATGLVIAALGLRGLGAALTASPVPRDDAALVTAGVYGRVRHPVYSGILLGGLAFVLIGASVWHALVWLALLALFEVKSRWEERMLIEAHPTYRDYAARVGRFIPGVGRVRQ